jgi:hypothetical protein
MKKIVLILLAASSVGCAAIQEMKDPKAYRQQYQSEEQTVAEATEETEDETQASTKYESRNSFGEAMGAFFAGFAQAYVDNSARQQEPSTSPYHYEAPKKTRCITERIGRDLETICREF